MHFFIKQVEGQTGLLLPVTIIGLVTDPRHMTPPRFPSSKLSQLNVAEARWRIRMNVAPLDDNSPGSSTQLRAEKQRELDKDASST